MIKIRLMLPVMEKTSLACMFCFPSRSCGVTLESCFFQVSSYSRAYVGITYDKTKGKSLLE